jgi:hypothetical protein
LQLEQTDALKVEKVPKEQLWQDEALATLEKVPGLQKAQAAL